ncbi:MAG: 30S ribosomal protein S18 [Chloroflexi bacterium]|nr:30S ribosomal protein S18 [Chloroflexota bacterium]
MTTPASAPTPPSGAPSPGAPGAAPRRSFPRRPAAGGPRRPGTGGPPRREGGRRYIPRRKVCQFCADKDIVINYKAVDALRRFVSDRGRIEPRRRTGNCARHQRVVVRQLKRARQLGLVPYTAESPREGTPSR